MIKRVALVGASSTGKTTVYELLKSKLPKWEFVNESTRTVQRYGFLINEEGTDETQLAISSFHLAALLNPYNLVLDRCYLDLVVYTDEERVSDSTYHFIQDMFERVKGEYTHVVYFPIEFEAVEDGVRSVDEDWRQYIDGRFRRLLDAHYWNNYLTVSGSPLQRVNQILNYLRLPGERLY